MFNTHRLIGSSLFVFVLSGAAVAQENRAPIDTPREPTASVPAGPLVTATASAERVRFTSPGTVVQLRLEVYNETGQKLFDTELRGGNVLDWHLQDGAGQRLPTGSYACVLTTKSLSGRLSQRVGLVAVTDEKTAVEAADAGQLSRLTSAQQQVIGPVEGNAAFTVLQESKAEAITAITHDGTDGQVTRTRGAFSFRFGDFFSGKDTEQMRLTEEGNLGIGTANPKAKLDVVGMISAREGFRFADGSTLNVNDKGVLTQTTASGELVPNIGGTGTQNKLAKWLDNSGTLGDSVVTEASGNIGVGITNPGQKLHVVGSFSGTNPLTPDRIGAFVNDGTPANHSILAVIAGSNGVAGIDLGDTQNQNQSYVRYNNGTLGEKLRFGINNTDVLALQSNGNVGIGTPIPVQKLDVAGTINTSTQYNIGNSRVLSLSGSDLFPNTNLFIGLGAGQSSAPPGSHFDEGNFNTFVGSRAGFSNTLGDQNSFFGQDAGQAIIAGRFNSFFGKNAGLSSQMGCCNSFFGVGAGQNTLGDQFLIVPTGIENSFFGYLTGISNIDGGRNSFFGTRAGDTNNAGDDNTIIGAAADVGSGDLNNATAIGAKAQVNQSNSLVLGSINGVNSATADTNVGIGTPAPIARLHVNGTSSGEGTPVAIIESSGSQIPLSFKSSGTEVARIRADNSGNLIFATVGGPTKDIHFRAGVDDSGTELFIQSSTSRVGIGTTAPDFKLHVNGMVAGSGPYVDASDLRYKRDILTIGGALSKVLSLRGVTFDWRREEFPALDFAAGRSVGFVAQEVERVVPEAVTRDAAGFRSVAYSHLTPVLVEAVKEQQEQITAQQQTITNLRFEITSFRKSFKDQQTLIQNQQSLMEQLQKSIERQELQITALKKLGCAITANAEICKN